MRLRSRIALVAACLLLAALTGCSLRQGRTEAPDRLILLVSDGAGAADPAVAVWLDAAAEEGLHLEVMTDSQFLSPVFGEVRCAGLILPDQAHTRSSATLRSAVERYVTDGGALMLVYDAGAQDLDGRYAGGQSPFSPLAGTSYVLYDKLRESTIRWSPVWAPQQVWDSLEVPPGKAMPYAAGGTGAQALVRYKLGELKYPAFVTAGDYQGEVLLRSSAGVVAGKHSYGKGSVLLVNLPLGYLTMQTDGLLQHAFLRYFAVDVLSLPRLSPVPSGVGGIILNWHLDSNAALKPLSEMATWGILDQGPYSIHITAGPDDRAPSDKLGLNVDHNAAIQKWIQTFLARGDVVASHGGWMHDYFGLHVNDDDQAQFEPYLAMNKESLERLTSRPVREYSAPVGTQPRWVTEWLLQHGFRAYYFTGDAAMAPTRAWRDGRPSGDIWAFPIQQLDAYASFEEMHEDALPTAQVAGWLLRMADFTAGDHVARLVYFHPPGSLAYRDAVRAWLARTAQLSAAGRFRWYTMTGLADFLDARRSVDWKVSPASGGIQIAASHPRTLAQQAWLLPHSRYRQPRVLEGVASVRNDSDDWVVTAGEGPQLKFEAGVK